MYYLQLTWKMLLKKWQNREMLDSTSARMNQSLIATKKFNLQAIKTKHFVLPNVTLVAFSTLPGCDAWNIFFLPRELIKYIQLFCYSSFSDGNSIVCYFSSTCHHGDWRQMWLTSNQLYIFCCFYHVLTIQCCRHTHTLYFCLVVIARAIHQHRSSSPDII